jgi:hypothetical protein
MKVIKILFLLVTVICFSSSFKAFAFQNQTVEIAFDFETARATLNAFAKKDISDGELSQIARLAGNRGLLHQQGRFDKQATEENFKIALKQISEKGVSEPDTFAFNRVKAQLAATTALLSQIENNQKALADSIAERIMKYAPPAGIKVNVKVYFIVGGTSDGFAPDSNIFYVALHYFGDDYEGLKLLMSHELYHNAQAGARGGKQFVKESDAANIKNCFDFLRNTLDEGTASVVGDPLEVAGGKKWISWFQGKFKNNLGHIEGNFTLFDTLLYRLYNDPNADSGKIYYIGFTATYDSPLYFVGYRMARVIEKHKGKNAVASLIGENPIQFFAQYMDIYKKNDDADAVHFSKSAEEILQKLASPAR